VVTHYQVEVLEGVLSQPACQQHRDAFEDSDREVRMTDRDEEVTCKRCLKAMGIEPPPVEQLTECLPDPLRRAA
jgi:hypothetical protein